MSAEPTESLVDYFTSAQLHSPNQRQHRSSGGLSRRNTTTMGLLHFTIKRLPVRLRQCNPSLRRAAGRESSISDGNPDHRLPHVVEEILKRQEGRITVFLLAR